MKRKTEKDVNVAKTWISLVCYCQTSGLSAPHYTDDHRKRKIKESTEMDGGLQSAFNLLVRNILREVGLEPSLSEKYSKELEVYNFAPEIDRLVRCVKLNY